MLKNWALRVALDPDNAAEKLAHDSRGDVLRNATIMLCTIASTKQLLKPWEDCCWKEQTELDGKITVGQEEPVKIPEPLIIHTIIG